MGCVYRPVDEDDKRAYGLDGLCVYAGWEGSNECRLGSQAEILGS